MRGIIQRMIYVYRMRRLVKIVRDETKESTDPMGHHNGTPYLTYCLIKLQGLRKITRRKYTESEARQILAMATDKDNHYLSLDNSEGKLATDQRARVTGKGLIFLTPTGYINALAGSIGHLSPVGSWLVAIASLIVSILLAIHVIK